MFRPEYNDLQFPVNKDYMAYASKIAQEKYGMEIDEQLLNHIGFLYMRDLLCIYEDSTEQNMKYTHHFEVIPSLKIEYSKHKLELYEIQATSRTNYRR